MEFAIIASLLFLILFGTIQFGLVFNRYQGVQAAAREAARLGSLGDTLRPDIVQRVSDSLSIVSPANKVDPCPAHAYGTPPTLAVDKWCVDVYRRSAPGVDPPTLHSVNTTPGPCNAIQPGDTKSVVVRVWYRTKIDIPLWSSPELTVSGLGEFRCE